VRVLVAYAVTPGVLCSSPSPFELGMSRGQRVGQRKQEKRQWHKGGPVDILRTLQQELSPFSSHVSSRKSGRSSMGGLAGSKRETQSQAEVTGNALPAVWGESERRRYRAC